ncbi:hypothetical protein PGTUg99_029078 [Puccinia graminis f. sp. tritici]|uniref:Major facilitator superfamily (MFS) profile domain-containing protein n=1 Tax=Puccinia graminis f. sp. tritici TaxID=56615 RepID=A0A5B0NHI8_PUCGR|nr:hypothetical protein PGTUg99_029078 [Puccinia graminis f. sp. tritici]
MDHSLGLHGKQYNVGLAVFYITYILSELPSNYMLRIMGGKIWLPFLVASWGVITIFSGFMKNYASLLVIRLLLGQSSHVCLLSNCKILVAALPFSPAF